MKQEDKELLLKDLSARSFYKLKVKLSTDETCILLGVKGDKVFLDIDSVPFNAETILSYLRPMSSMTKEERNEYHFYCDYYYGTYFDTVGSIDWLNSHHFDYRGLIEKGLALEALEGMYNIKD